MNGYEEARERYAVFGVDTEAALTALNERRFPLMPGSWTT